MLKKWDWAWKTFFDCEMPWADWFIKSLLGDMYDWVAAENVVFHDLPTEAQTAHSASYEDKFFVATVDQQKHKVHLEFESKFDKTIGLRMLKYGLDNLTPEDSNYQNGAEEYQLPISHIVRVRRWRTGQAYTARVVRLNFGTTRAAIYFRIIEGFSKIPFISSIMTAATFEEWMEAVQALESKLPVMTDNSVIRDKFLNACVMLCSPRAFEDGVDDGRLTEMTEAYKKNAETFEEHYTRLGVERGEENFIKRIMDAQGWTREQVLALTEKPANGSKGVNKMKL